MKKKVQVIRLATEKLEGAILPSAIPKNIGKRPYHLYILSNDELKEGDRVYSKHYGLGVVVEDNHPNYKGELPIRVKYPNITVPYFKDGGYSIDRKLIYLQDCKKIIATTDSKLWQSVANNYSRENGVWGVHKVQQSFVKEYVKQGGIDEVEVEYEVIQCNHSDTFDCNCISMSVCRDIGEIQLKLTSNNEVIISLVEKEEETAPHIVEMLCRKAYQEGVCWGRGYNNTLSEDEWIKKNLRC